MKVSRHWLQKFFDQPLPDVQVLSDALTFHVFEIDGLWRIGDDDILDVKVTPNRGHDCFSHRGIAKEVSAILQIPLTHDPLSEVPVFTPTTDKVSVSIADPGLCPRYIAGYLSGVTVGPSPQWLSKRLEALGQRSINNVVDVTNFVMFTIGQPLHAFDARKLKEKDGSYAISVRFARNGEILHALDEKEYALTPSMLVIADEHADLPIGIAGVKGGMPAGITEETADIIIESANFNGVSVRKTAQALLLRTDASVRFEQTISPEIAAYGMRLALELIQKIAGGNLEGFADEYPEPFSKKQVSVSLTQINTALGTSLEESVVADVFTRLGFSFDVHEGVFTVEVPFERLDITISEDLIEEVARIVGYENILSRDLPPFPKAPEINKNFYYTEKIREFLNSRGYCEVYISVFSEEGKRAVLNKVGGGRPYLRGNLSQGLKEAVEKNKSHTALLALSHVRLFEIGTVFKAKEEKMHMAVAGGDGQKVIEEMYATLHVSMPPTSKKESEVIEIDLDDLVAQLPEPKEYENLPLSSAVRYEPFSLYPVVLRDLALWVPKGTTNQDVENLVREVAGELLANIYLFDTYEKGDRVSYAFRLVFQSFEKTLSDEEVNMMMEKINAALIDRGFEVR